MVRSETQSIVTQDLSRVNPRREGAEPPPREILAYGAKPVPGLGRMESPLGGPRATLAPSPSAPWRKLLRYPGTIGMVFLLVAVPLGMGVWSVIGPKYTAVGKLRVRPIIPRLVFQTEENGVIPYYDYYANTQADLVRSPQVLQKTLDQPAVKQTQWFRTGLEKNPDTLVDRFMDDLNVQYKPKTEIVEVSLTAKSPQEAAAIINSLMEEYVRYVKSNANQVRDFFNQKLAEAADSLQDEIENRLKTAADLRKEVAGGAKEKFQLLSDEEETIRHKKELAETMRTRLDQKEFERNIPGGIEVMAEAPIPSEPSEDRRKPLTLAVVIAGLASGLGMGYLRVRLNQTVYDPEDLTGLLDEPLLGRLPFIFPKRPLTGEEIALQGDWVRKLRTLLLTRMNGPQGRAISIASSRKGAGKTMVAILLAKSLVLCGKKVLLIDANLKKPAIGDYFGNPKSSGLLGVLTHSQDPGHVVKTEYSLLDVLPAGTIPSKTPPDLLADGTMAGVLQQWKDQYDYILVDTPPVLSAAEGGIISQLMDATILVVRRRHCRRNDIIETLDYLDACGGAVMGLVYVS